MSRDDDELIEKLILDGGVEAVAVDEETGELKTYTKEESMTI